jgi:hypothetical protein
MPDILTEVPDHLALKLDRRSVIAERSEELFEDLFTFRRHENELMCTIIILRARLKSMGLKFEGIDR